MAEARYIGEVFGIFSLGLVPYMMFQLLLRVFYALHDSRTPMFIGVAVMVANIAISLLALNVLPAGHVVEGLGVSFGVSNVVGTVVSWLILTRRLGGLAGHQIADSLIRMNAAAVPALSSPGRSPSWSACSSPPGPSTDSSPCSWAAAAVSSSTCCFPARSGSAK